MADATVDVSVDPDGSHVLLPPAVLDAGDAVELRRTVVHAGRRVRPLRLIVDLRNVHKLDAINLGTLAAACYRAGTLVPAQTVPAWGAR